MAIRKPLYWSSSGTYGAGLRELSDIDLEVMSYYLRKAYANLLNSSIDVSGQIRAGDRSGWTFIGDISNNIRKIAYTVSAKANDDKPAPGDDNNPDNIGPLKTDYSDSVDYNYYQYRTIPARPNSTTTTAYSYLAYDSTLKGLTYLGYPIGTNGDKDVVDTIITECKNQIIGGDELASYRISTTTPTNGSTPGVWTNKGEFFRDTIYNGTSTAYNLYLKTSLDEVPSPSQSNIYTYSNGGLRTMAYGGENSNFIQYFLLPHLLRNYPTYTITGTKPTVAINEHGLMIETYYTQTSTTVKLTNNTYTRIDTPTRGRSFSKTLYYLKVE